MNLCKRLLCTAILVALIGFVCSGAWAADSLTGSISGTVSDSTGAVIVAATVTITNTDRGQDLRVLTTNSTGYYTATSLPLGTYTVKVTAPGFKTDTVTGLQLHAADSLTVNKMLTTGSVNEVITVTAAQAQLNLEDSTSSGLITGDQMNELVLNNRNYEQFLTLQPGVVYGGATDQLYVGSTAPGGMANTVNFSVNGGRNTSNNWTVDGADNVDRGANLTLLTYPSVDAIAEIKTLRGQYSAEFGRSASGQIDVVTKSGTNIYHGSAYEFWRNNILNANTWGNKLNQPVQPRAILRYNDFGESVGGPVRIPHIYNGKDKTFFFFSDETRRLVQYTSGTALVPTAAERSGDFSNSWYQDPATHAWKQGPVAVCTAYNPANGACTAYGDSIPSTTQSSTAKAYLKDIFSLIPAPPDTANVAAGLDPHSLAATVPNTYNDNQLFVRIDQSFGQKLNVFYRYLHDSFPITSGTGTFTTTPIPGLSTTITTNPGTQQMGHATYLFSPTLLANAGFAYSSNAILTTPVGALTSAASTDISPTLPYTNTLGVVPTISIASLTGLGSTGIYNDYDFNRNLFGDVTKTLGRHTIIAGATYNHYRKQENSTGGNNGSFSFITQTVPTTPNPAGGNFNGAYQSSIAMSNFLLGNANGGFSQASIAITADILEDDFEAFVQDNYKFSPRLTLNIGVRYGYYGQPTDGHNRMSSFDPATFDQTKTPAIMNSGLMCLGSIANQTGTTCLNTNQVPTNPLFPGEGGSVTVNANQDYYGINYINGMIFQNNSGVPGHASPFGNKVGQADNYNFAPRVGFAYDVFGDGKTSLRGGYGWAYDSSEVSYYETQVFNNPPAVTSYSLSTAVLDDPAGIASKTPYASTTPGRIVASPINYHTPYIQQFSLDMQHTFTPTFMIDIGYFGTHGTHLLGLLDINEPMANTWVGKVSPQNATTSANPQYCYPGTSGATCVPSFLNSTTDRVLNSIKPYPGYFAIDAVQSIFNSNYNGLQVKATKKFAGKSMIDANYTWSRDLTNAQADYTGGPQNTYNINGDYGRAADDRKQVLTVDGVYELPWMKDQRGVIGHVIGGWEASGILAMNSGLPLTITESSAYTINYTYQGAAYTGAYNNQTNGNFVTDAAGIGVLGNTNAGLRPSQIGNPNNGNGTKIHNRYQWFYEGAFATPIASNTGGQVGNEKRGVVSAPGFTRVDLGLFRNIKIHGEMNLQIRGEAFNLFNHTNLGAPVTSASSSSFGQITGARDNRIMQIAGKFTF
jgi:hypothetical protein